MPNPNTGAVDPALEPERMPKKGTYTREAPFASRPHTTPHHPNFSSPIPHPPHLPPPVVGVQPPIPKSTPSTNEQPPLPDDPSPKNTPSVPDDKYGNRDTKEREGGRENQEMTRKTRSAKNRLEEGQATHART